MRKKSLDSSPDETRTFEKGKIELVNLGDITIGRGVFEPGWTGRNALNLSLKQIVVKFHTQCTSFLGECM